MVQHIVLWKLKEENLEENVKKIKEGLERLVGIIPGLVELTVGRNENGDIYDLCLVSKFENHNALTHYKGHPEHKKIQSFVHSVIIQRTAVDFELSVD